MLRNFLKTAVRNLLRHRIYSFINIAGLSLGLACTMLIILYIKDELSYDRFHKNVNNIYRIGMDRKNPDGTDAGSGGYSGYFQGPRFTAGVPEIKSFVRMQSRFRDIKMGVEIKSKEIHFVDSNFFSFFSFPLISGDARSVLLDPNSVVLSESMAKQLFGNKEAQGKIIMAKKDDGEFYPYSVSGVARRVPENSSIKFDFLFPIQVSKEDEANNGNWFNFFLNTFVTLNPGAAVTTVESKMQQVYESDARESIKKVIEEYNDNTKTQYHLQALTDLHLGKPYVADNGLSGASNPILSYILSGIAIFILLIACINFVNLTIARSLKRAREIGVRKVMGGDKRQLIFQFLGESFVICFIAFLFAIVWVQLTLPLFNQLSNKALALSYLFDVKLIAGYISLFVITGFLAGFYPALVLSGFNPVQVLYKRFVWRSKNYLQKSLVILQFALASFLIIGTIIIYSQFTYLTNKELGYDDTNLVSLELGGFGITHDRAEVLRTELKKDPNIIEVANKNGGRWGTVAKVNGETQIFFTYETVDESYLPMFEIPLVEGRNFSKEFPSDSTHSILVNESFVKKAGWKDPIGQEVNFWYSPGEKYKVIGVVKDYHYEALTQGIDPQLFTMKPGNRFGKSFIKIKPNSASAALAHIEKVFKTFFPTNPYVYTFKDEENLKSYEAEAKWKQIMLFSAVLTIFISCIGLFGLSVLAAEKRTKEIGIRKVLGATVGGITAILSKDFLKLVLVAFMVAIPVAWFLSNKWLENYPYRITLSWWMFVSAMILVVLIAVITVCFQSIKAALSNPVKSLRTE